MFLGHFAVGLGAKRAAPKVSLGTLFVAAQLIDLLWPTFLLLGIERVKIDPGATPVTPLDFEHYPVSHSLLAVIAWGIGLGLAYYAFRRRAREAVILGAAVVSHWLLDALVHRPDLPLYPGGGPMIGLGLWFSMPATLAVELMLLAIGVRLYTRTTKAKDATGRWSLWTLIAFLIAVYFANLFGPPPPSETAIAWVGQSQWLLIAWGYWIDRHRVVQSRR